jgi:hypothetical protein
MFIFALIIVSILFVGLMIKVIFFSRKLSEKEAAELYVTMWATGMFDKK